MGKPHSRSGSQKKAVTFLLDECLPYRVADNLKEVGYPIISWHEEFQGEQGIKEPYLIQYLGAKGYTWITKDDEAKKEHKEAINVAAISVIWVRGLARQKGKPKKNEISIKDLHRMLTDKLDYAESEISASNKPQYFMLYMKSSGIPAIAKITLESHFG